MRRSHKKFLLAIIILALLGTVFSFAYIKNKFQLSQDNPGPAQDDGNVKYNYADATPPTSLLAPPLSKPLPHSVLLKVPFTSQAPTANWDELHNEACEEATSIMADQYFNNNASPTLDPVLVEREISSLTAWQDKNLGYHLDTTTEETAEMIRSVYKLHVTIKNEFTEEYIKNELTKGNIILVSTNGRLLGNPNYKQPGPVHHMLLIKGFTETTIITNDSGTKRGLNYAYSFTTIHNAAGDWNHDTKSVDTQTKKIIVVSKP